MSAALRGALLAVLLLALPAAAEEPGYRLAPRQVAPDTWVLVGATEDFDTRNGGNIVNTGFIVTEAGVVVIDTGPSRRYGEELRAAIGRVTDRPVVLVLNTHHHPDHVFGNQAFADPGVSALPASAAALAAEGGAFADNLYRMSGNWMAGTEPAPAQGVIAPGRRRIGGHELEFLALGGHTGADLAVFDRTTGVLFTGDLVFFQRAPTTPHARVPEWLGALAALEQLPYRVMVPGHGPVLDDGRGIAQTRDWLQWLTGTLAAAAREGRDMSEVLATPLPARFRDLPLAAGEYRRSVAHLYPALERAELGRRP